jgi:ethanolaminephosphotransferase
VQTWDEYHTKTLTLGLVSGPVEGIVILISVYAFTAYKGGASFWQQSMFRTVGVPEYSFIPSYVYNLPFNEWWMVQGGLVLVLNTVQSYVVFFISFALQPTLLKPPPHSSLNVIKARRAKGDKSRYALVGLLPFFLTWTLIPSYLYLNPEILYHHLVPFVFFAGLVNAYSVGQIITAHLVQLDFPYYNVLTLPLAYGVVDSLGPWLQQTVGLGWPSALGDGGYSVAYLFCMLGMGIGVYGSFVVRFNSSRFSVPSCHFWILLLWDDD